MKATRAFLVVALVAAALVAAPPASTEPNEPNANPEAAGPAEPDAPEPPPELPATIEVTSAIYDTSVLPTGQILSYLTDRAADGTWQATYDADGLLGQVVNNARQYGATVSPPPGWTYDAATNEYAGQVPITIQATNLDDPAINIPATAATADVVAQLKSVRLTEDVPQGIFRPAADWSGAERTIALDPSNTLDGMADVFDLGTMALAEVGCFGMHAHFEWRITSSFTADVAGLGTYSFDSSRTIELDSPWSAAASALKSAVAADEGVDTSEDLTERCAPPADGTWTEVEIIKPPSPPVAVIKATPDAGRAPLVTTLDGSDSYDDDGEIVEYQWGWYSPQVDHTTTTATTPANYPNTGAPSAWLRVKDDDGLLSSWVSVWLCSAGAPWAQVPWWFQHGQVPHVNALVQTYGVISPYCQGHPNGPKIVYARFAWDDRDGNAAHWYGTSDYLHWHGTSFMYPGHNPWANETPDWRAYGRGWRYITFAGVDSFGTWSNVVGWHVLINTPPKATQGTHFCEPRPCSNHRRRAHIEAWAHDDTGGVQYIADRWWVHSNTGALVHSGDEAQWWTTKFDKWIEYNTGIPYTIEEHPRSVDHQGEAEYQSICNWYRHNWDHSPTNNRWYC